MTVAQTRRQLFGRLRGGGPQLRPPWAREELSFTQACTQCGKCHDACPQGLIIDGHAGYPIVTFKNDGCTFCGQCVQACDEDCFTAYDEGVGKAWNLRISVSEACVEPKGVTCRMCLDACEFGALSIRPMLGGRAQLSIDADCCTGCGACISSCPVAALATIEQPFLEAAS